MFKLRAKLVSLFSAVAITAIMVVPVSAVGGCDPGRASNPGSVLTYAQVAKTGGGWIDDMHGTPKDHDPFVETSRTKVYVELYDAGTPAHAQFGWFKSDAGAFKFFTDITATNGDLIEHEEYTNDVPGTSNDLDGSGDYVKIGINRRNDVLAYGFELNIDGQQKDVIGFGNYNLWQPDRARVVYEINDGGSQWWGQSVAKQITKDINIDDNSGNAMESGLIITNTTNKAQTSMDTGDGKRFLVHDKDCT